MTISSKFVITADVMRCSIVMDNVTLLSNSGLCTKLVIIAALCFSLQNS